MSTPTDQYDKLVANYIKLRDTIKEKDKEYKEKMAPAKELLDKMNSKLLDLLNKSGQDAAKTSHGTVYRKSRGSATVVDATAFRRFVIGGELWDLCDIKANVTAVADFIEKENAPPPGVNYTKSYDVGVRKPS